MKQVRAALAILILTLLTAVGPGAPNAWGATGSAVQQAIDQQLAKVPGGVQVSPSEIAYHGGSVVMVFPDATGRVPTSRLARPELATASGYPYGCPSGTTQKWYCFYRDANYAGRMLEFRDCSLAGTQQRLSDYGFAGQTTSWVNTKTDTVVEVDDSSNRFLWVEGTADSSPNVGPAANDRADIFWAVC